MRIKEWSEDERPREKVMTYGVESVSNAELLAILIGSGTPEESSVELMRRMMQANDDKLRLLGTMTLKDLEVYKGIGPAKAITIMAAMELGKRMLREELEHKKFENSKEMYDYFRSHMMDLAYEEVHVMLLDVKRQMIGHKVISKGGISQSQVDVRVVLKYALQGGATSIVIAHNHPSGNPMPSREDDRLTERLKEACRTVDIRLQDHIVIGNNGFYSYYDQRKI